MIRRKRPQILADYSTKLRGKSDFEGETLQLEQKPFFGLHPILAKKHFNFWGRPFFVGLHSILATELHNLH